MIPWKTLTYIFFLNIPLYAIHSVDIATEVNGSILTFSDVCIVDKNITKEQLIAKECFAPYSNDNIHRSQSQKSVWVHFILENSSTKEIKKIVVLNSPSLENIALYRGDSDDVIYNGITQNKVQSTLYYFYHITLPAKSSYDYYLKVSSLHTSFFFNITIQEYQQFRDNDLKKQAPRILMLGILLGLMLYVVLLSFYSGDKSYAYYGFYLFCIIGYQTTFLGLSKIYLPHWLVLMDMKLLISKLGLMLFSSILFSITFLKIPTYGWIFKLYMFFMVISIIMIFILKSLFITLIIGVLFIFFNFSVSIFVYGKGQKQARLFIVGFGVVSVAYLMIISDSFGFTSFLDVVPNILMWATIIEVLSLTLAFADRYKILQELKEKDDKEREEIIQHEVIEKTAELKRVLTNKEVLIEEVHHRVKNNLQIILSMIRLQRDSMHEELIKDKLINLENRINAISKTYSMLIVEDRLAQIDMDEYIEALLIDIKSSMFSNTLDIHFHTHIEIDLPLGKAVYIGIIINELVTNAYKYAFPDGKGDIYIELYQEDSGNILILYDSGEGFVLNKNRNSLGLKILETLITEQLHGTLKVESLNHAKYIIKFE